VTGLEAHQGTADEAGEQDGSLNGCAIIVLLVMSLFLLRSFSGAAAVLVINRFAGQR